MHPPRGYKFISLLGRGQATTWLAEIDNGRIVPEFAVIKTLELKNVSNWKGIELFEREVKVLQQLEHPSIPKFINFIKDEYDGSKRWHIVQEKVVGKNPDPDSYWSERRLRELAVSVLESLVYLQSFSPPLLHRDIKPGNLIRKKKGYSLIDFGAVRHVVPSDDGGSTVVGTSGYMAPEQLMGRADKSSDLYGLGMTLIHLISGTHPDELEKKRMQVQWSGYQNKFGEGFIDFVNQLTEPHAENRFESAEEALAFLDEFGGPPKNLIRREKSRFKISLSKNRETIHVRRTRFELLKTNEFAPYFIFIGLVLGFMFFKEGIGQYLLLLLFCVPIIILGLILLLGFKRTSASIRYTEKGLETTGRIERESLTEAQRKLLDHEIQKLTNRYSVARDKHLDARLFVEDEEKKSVEVEEEF